VSPLLASKGSKKHLLGHISSFECCNFAKKKLVSPWLISNFCYYWCTVVRWWEMYVFFKNDLFVPGIGYFTPQISLKNCFFRLLRTQWPIFTIHSDPLGGNSQKWMSTVVRWAETAKKLRSNIPRSALCATLDTYNFIIYFSSIPHAPTVYSTLFPFLSRSSNVIWVPWELKSDSS
jgi:hypothetical protein